MRFSKFIIIFLVFVLSMQFLIAETNFYLHGASGAAKITRDSQGNEEITYIVNDRLGNQRLLLDGKTKEVIETYKSLPYGQQLTDNKEIKYGFTGKEEDKSGLHYFNARYYDADMGKFTSVDPVEDNHAYSYVTNNPLKYVDPSGMEYVNFENVKAEVSRVAGEVLNLNWRSNPVNKFLHRTLSFYRAGNKNSLDKGDGIKALMGMKGGYTGGDWAEDIHSDNPDVVGMYMGTVPISFDYFNEHPYLVDNMAVYDISNYVLIEDQQKESIRLLIEASEANDLYFHKQITEDRSTHINLKGYFDEMYPAYNGAVVNGKSVSSYFNRVLLSVNEDTVNLINKDGTNAFPEASNLVRSDIALGRFSAWLGKDSSGYYVQVEDIIDYKGTADDYSGISKDKNLLQAGEKAINILGKPFGVVAKVYIDP